MTKENEFFFVKDNTKDYHTKDGMIKKEDLKNNGKVLTNKGKEMFVLDPEFLDRFNKIKRGPQIVTKKDIGIIISETGINKNSKIIDAGGGSGALCSFLANVAKHVTSYEKRKEFYEVVLFNKEFLGLKNLKVKNKDITEGIGEKNIDVITLDLPEPWDVLENAYKALKPGGFIAIYLPTINQTKETTEKLKEIKGLQHIKTIENIQREWELKEKIIRPKYSNLAHTAFITIIRKVE